MVVCDGILRRPFAIEQARMLGYTSTHFECLGRKCLASQVEDTAGDMVGNTFAVVVVARLVAGFVLGATKPLEVLPDDGHGPGTVPWLWKQWEGAELQATAAMRSERLGWTARFARNAVASTQASSSSSSFQKLTDAQQLVGHYLRLADHKGSDVRLDLGMPYRFAAWPRAPIDSGQWAWKVTLSYRWKDKAHINVLETQAVFDCLRHVAKHPRHHDSRRLVLVDSQVALGLLTKGRSSSRRINQILVRLAAVAKASNIMAFYGWVPSKANPADGPSRWSVVGLK